MISLMKKVPVVFFSKLKTLSQILYSTIFPPQNKNVLHFSNSHNDVLHESSIPKKIWLYWDSLELPLLTELCLFNIKGKCQGYEVNILNSGNYSQYIPEIDFPEGILLAHKSDLIRLSLLAEHGGIWIDATSIVFDNFDWIINRCSGDDVFLCYSDDCTLNLESPIAENWIIAAPAGSDFIKDWLNEFRESIYSNLAQEHYKYLSERKDIIQSIPDLSYLRCYVAAALTMRRKHYNLQMVNSGSTGHFLNYELKSKAFFIAITVCFVNSSRFYRPPVLKFTSSTRKWVEIFIKKGFFRKCSMIGSLQYKLK